MGMKIEVHAKISMQTLFLDDTAIQNRYLGHKDALGRLCVV
jgi:hypothetical protein